MLRCRSPYTATDDVNTIRRLPLRCAASQTLAAPSTLTASYRDSGCTSSRCSAARLTITSAPSRRARHLRQIADVHTAGARRLRLIHDDRLVTGSGQQRPQARPHEAGAADDCNSHAWAIMHERPRLRRPSESPGVSAVEQKLGQIGTVLPRHSRDECGSSCSFHVRSHSLAVLHAVLTRILNPPGTSSGSRSVAIMTYPPPQPLVVLPAPKLP